MIKGKDRLMLVLYFFVHYKLAHMGSIERPFRLIVLHMCNHSHVLCSLIGGNYNH